MTFKAAYWTDGHSSVLLTDESQADMSDRELIDAAAAMADRVGLEMGDGRIEVGQYRR